MASSPPNLKGCSAEDGFATPAAVVISLAMATIAVAVQARAISALHASQADYVRTTAELRLDGAQQLIDTALVRGALATPNDTQVTIGGVVIDAQAQSETAKFGLASAVQLDGAALAALGASEPETVRSGLARLATTGDTDPADLRGLDPSLRWKACAAEAISAYGGSRSPPAAMLSAMTVAYAGEVWRTVVRDGWGWTDDRLVRITGDEASPVRVIFRNFHRNTAGRVPCPSLDAAFAAG